MPRIKLSALFELSARNSCGLWFLSFFDDNSNVTHLFNYSYFPYTIQYSFQWLRTFSHRNKESRKRFCCRNYLQNSFLRVKSKRMSMCIGGCAFLMDSPISRITVQSRGLDVDFEKQDVFFSRSARAGIEVTREKETKAKRASTKFFSFSLDGWLLSLSLSFARARVHPSFAYTGCQEPEKASVYIYVCVGALRSVTHRGAAPFAQTNGGKLNEPCCVTCAHQRLWCSSIRYIYRYVCTTETAWTRKRRNAR